MEAVDEFHADMGDKYDDWYFTVTCGLLDSFLFRMSSIAMAELKHYQLCYELLKEREEKVKAAVAECA